MDEWGRSCDYRHALSSSSSSSFFKKKWKKKPACLPAYAPIDPPRAAAVAAVVGRWAPALLGREPPVESAALLYMP